MKQSKILILHQTWMKVALTYAGHVMDFIKNLGHTFQNKIRYYSMYYVTVSQHCFVYIGYCVIWYGKSASFVNSDLLYIY